MPTRATAPRRVRVLFFPDLRAAGSRTQGLGYVVCVAQVLLETKGQFDRRCEHLQRVVEAERARADDEQRTAARERATAAAAEVAEAGLREEARQLQVRWLSHVEGKSDAPAPACTTTLTPHHRHLQVRLEHAATALSRAEADAAAEREATREAARAAERAAKATRELEAEKEELNGRLGEQQQFASELQEQIVAHKRMRERMQQVRHAHTSRRMPSLRALKTALSA